MVMAGATVTAHFRSNLEVGPCQNSVEFRFNV